MVFDKIENYRIYAGLSEQINRAFAYINETDFSQTTVGKYHIDNDDVFALVQEYDTKEREECKLEGHMKHIDLQYVVSGIERMGVVALTNQLPVVKSEEDDYCFYESDMSLIAVGAGMFTLFFPDDLHMPCMKFGQISKVKKVVVKIRI